MTDAVPLCLATNGYATIYLNVPPGSFREEYTHVTRMLARQSGENADRQKGILSEIPEVLYLLGQARFAARVQASDYTEVLDRAYPDRESKALVSNAVFSIPFVTDKRAALVKSKSRIIRFFMDLFSRGTPVSNDHEVKTTPGMIRFLTHLRVRRTVYATNPLMAESRIIEELRVITNRLGGNATIEAGLGWADFVISGAVPPKQLNAFLAALVDFNRVKIDRESSNADCVFSRSLTLLGYAWTGEHSPPVVNTKMSALMFIRARPGCLSKIEQLVTDSFPSTEVAFVDGKIDVIATMKSRKRSDFFQRHEELSEESGPDFIEKFETHLIFGHDLFSDAGDVRPENTIERYGCECTKRVVQPELVYEVVPGPLARAIRNIEFLFSSTIHDPANCCDARSAIQSCQKSVKRLLMTSLLSKFAINLSEEEKQKPEVVFATNDAIYQTLHRVELWVLLSERILRQRTVGSFEEFLGQSDRAVSYRGGAQKILTVADNLMNDFFAKIVGLEEPEPYLTSLYDSVDRIKQVVGIGLVCMPVQALFFLPGVVPALWHEVGGFLFFLTIPPETLGLNFLPAPSDSDESVDGRPLEDLARIALYRDLADHYGDLVCFVYGFGCDIEQFATALLEGWVASQQPYQDVPNLVRELSYTHIVARIVAVFEFLVQPVVEERSQVPINDAQSAKGAVKDDVERRRVLFVLYEEVCKIARGYDSPLIPPPSTRIAKKVRTILEAKELSWRLDLLRQRIDYDDVVDARATLKEKRAKQPHFDFENPAPIRAYGEFDDLNEEFRKLYWAVMKGRREDGVRPHAFSQTAALIRGATLEYHRRSARGGLASA